MGTPEVDTLQALNEVQRLRLKLGVFPPRGLDTRWSVVAASNNRQATASSPCVFQAIRRAVSRWLEDWGGEP